MPPQQAQRYRRTYPVTVDRAALEAVMDREEVLGLLQDLVRVPSPTAGEEHIAAAVEHYAREAGFEDVRSDEHHNVLISFAGVEPGPTTLFLTHLDSAGPGHMEDPYTPTVLDGAAYGKPGAVVRGLGACAPKSAVAAMLSAACATQRLGLPRRGRILVAMVTKDMQANHEGARRLLGGLSVAIGRVVAGEPTGNKIAIGARGVNQLQVSLRGKPAHWGRPSEGVNPLYALADVLRAVEHAELPTDPALGPATITAVDVRSEAAPPQTSELAVLSVDRRTLPGEETAAVVDGVRRIVQLAVGARPGITAEVVLARAMHSWRTAEASSIVRDVRRAVSHTLGLELETSYITFASNAGYAIAERGWPGIALGPGNIADIGEREHVETAAVELATLLYASIMANG